ncbi:putative membrane protein [Paraburkholderia sp. GAS199]
MEVPVTEEQIQTLAFYLWEQDGSPEGRSQEYWEKAWQQLGVGAVHS